MKRKAIAMAMTLLLVLVTVPVSGCNATTVQAYANLAVKIGLQVATLCGAPKTATDKVSADMAQAEALYSDFAASAKAAKPGKLALLDAELNTAQADLNAVLDLAAVKDPKIIADARVGLSIGIMAIESIESIAGGQMGGTPVVTPVANTIGRTARVVLPGGMTPRGALSPAQLRAQYNAAMAAYPQAQVR